MCISHIKWCNLTYGIGEHTLSVSVCTSDVNAVSSQVLAVPGLCDCVSLMTQCCYSCVASVCQCDRYISERWHYLGNDSSYGWTSKH